MNELRPYLDELWLYAGKRIEYEQIVRRSFPLSYESIQDNLQRHWEPIVSICRKKLIMGAIRYGNMKHPGKPVWDRIHDAHRRMALYEETGNLEYLYDSINMLFLEIIEGHHPKKHWEPHDDGIHTKEEKKHVC